MDTKTLKEWREDRGISKVHVQKTLGMTEPTLRSREEGQSEWRAHEIRILRRLYNVDFHEIKELVG